MANRRRKDDARQRNLVEIKGLFHVVPILINSLSPPATASPLPGAARQFDAPRDGQGIENGIPD